MARIVFTANLQRHVIAPEHVTAAMSVRGALDDVFTANPQLRGYIVDDQGALRKHVFIFVDGARLPTAASLDVPIHAASEIHVLQALTGG